MARAQGPRVRKSETSAKSQKAKTGKKRIGIKRGFRIPILSGLFKIIGKALSKITPGFLKGAFSEIRQVSWPNKRETLRLTWAVFVFAIVFSIIVAALDFVLDKIFRSIILG